MRLRCGPKSTRQRPRRQNYSVKYPRAIPDTWLWVTIWTSTESDESNLEPESHTDARHPRRNRVGVNVEHAFQRLARKPGRVVIIDVAGRAVEKVEHIEADAQSL